MRQIKLKNEHNNTNEFRRIYRRTRSCCFLKEIRLYKCSINELPNGLFYESKLLEILDLDHNLIDNLPSSIFETNFKLKKISFNHNMFELVDLSIFSNLPELEFLYFNNNKISEIKNCFNKKNKKLQKVDFSHNSLTNLNDSLILEDNEEEADAEARFIYELNFEHNQIEKISERFFYKLEIKILNLMKNPIKAINFDMCLSDFSFFEIPLIKVDRRYLEVNFENLLADYFKNTDENIERKTTEFFLQ